MESRDVIRNFLYYKQLVDLANVVLRYLRIETSLKPRDMKNSLRLRLRQIYLFILLILYCTPTTFLTQLLTVKYDGRTYDYLVISFRQPNKQYTQKFHENRTSRFEGIR